MSLNIEKLSPLFADLRKYQLQWLSADLIAGLSVAAVQVPTALAYAQLSGFSPEVGLYASILPVIVYAFLGSSRQLVVGPDAATCAMVASLVQPLAAGDPLRYIALSSTLSLLAGGLMIVGGLTKMGFIVNFFARPVLVGFLNGIAASIIAGQLGKLFGVALKERDFLPSLIELSSKLVNTHWMTLGVGAFTIALLIVLKRLIPRAPIYLIALAIAAVGLSFAGGESSGVALVGNIPASLPHLQLPEMEYKAGQGLFVGALGLVIVSFTSGMLTARSFAARAKQTLDANQEMWAIGAANLAAGLSGSFAITGADSRTAVNAASGNKTQLSAVFSAVAIGAVATFLAQPIGQLPVAALAAVLIFSAVQLIDTKSYDELQQVDPFEFRLSVLTTAGVLTLGVLPGVALAITLALIIILFRIYKPEDTILGEVPGLDGYNDITLAPNSKITPGVTIWRFEGPLVFFNAEYFKMRLRDALSQEKSPKWFILDFESLTQLDATGIKTIEEVAAELQGAGINLLIARPKTYMRRLRQVTSLRNHISEQNVFPTIRAAVDSIAARSGTETGAAIPNSFASFYKDANGD